MGRHTDTTRQSLMGAAGATNLTPQHTARSPLPKTAHGGREEGDTGISISIVSPPPPTHTPRNTEAQQKHTARSRLCSCRGGGDWGERGLRAGGGGVGWEGRGQHAGLGPCRMRWHRDAEQRGDPHTAHRGMGGGMHAAGCPIREQFLGGKPPPQRGAQWDGGCPPPSWGRSRRNGDVGSPHSPGDKQQTAETPPATQSRKGGMSPFPQGAAAGQQGSPLPILWQRSAPTGCPLWQRARKERGARPPPR